MLSTRNQLYRETMSEWRKYRHCATLSRIFPPSNWFCLCFSVSRQHVPPMPTRCMRPAPRTHTMGNTPMWKNTTAPARPTSEDSYL